MYSLAIDSASPLGSIALTQGGQTLAHLSLKGKLTHAENLLPEIEALLGRLSLGMSDLGVLGVVLGPGSFTGVRIGIATVMGLSRGLGIPAYGLSTLKALAWTLPYSRRPICPLLDLRRGQIYGAVYDTASGEPVALVPEGHYPLDELLKKLPSEVVCLGHGARQAEDTLTEAEGIEVVIPRPLDGGGLAPIVAAWAADALRRGVVADATSLTPSYLQASAAERGRP